jgi:hypothetical protein
MPITPTTRRQRLQVSQAVEDIAAFLAGAPIRTVS